MRYRAKPKKMRYRAKPIEVTKKPKISNNKSRDTNQNHNYTRPLQI
jgi:hypothetical protein